MAIEFRCSRCNKLLRVDESSAGKKARCPECANIQDVPNASQMSGRPATDYPYYGQSTPAQSTLAQARPGAVPMSAPASFNPPTTPPPSSTAPSTTPAAPTPQYTSPGNPFAPQPSVGVNPYSDQMPQLPANPYGAPPQGYPQLSPAERTQRARNRVKPAAIALMAISLLYFLVAAFFLLGLVAAVSEQDEDATIGCAILSVICGLGGVVPMFTGLMMVSMRAYGLCMAGIILSIVTSLFIGCIPVVGIAIWALVVLLDTDVRAAFR